MNPARSANNDGSPDADWEDNLTPRQVDNPQLPALVELVREGQGQIGWLGIP